MHINVKVLPPCVQAALSSLGYGRADIAVHARESFQFADGGGAGKKSFVCIVDLASGKHATTWGSWGGANMFNPRNAVDLDTTVRPILPNMLVIDGSIGGGVPVYATIAAHPSTLAPLLDAAPKVDDRDASILACYRSLKSGPYRAEALARLKCTEADLERLAARGLLKRARNGATQITTDGKNACAKVNTIALF